MISIIVLHHNKAEYSRACLHSLLQTSSRPLEIINVNNGSADATAEILDTWQSAARAAGIETQRLDFPTNIGAIAGRNAAMQTARGAYFVFLDNDTLIFQDDWLEKLRAFLEEDENRGIVAPKLLFPWEPFAIECCGAAISPRGRVEYSGRGAARDSLQAPQRIQCAISAAWMMPRRVYEAIGGLDEIYSPVQYEDLDYCYRARQADLEIWTCPSVELFHFEHTTTAGSGDINFKYVTTKNGLTFKKRWGEHFVRENATTEDAAQWRVLPKRGIEDVDWKKLMKEFR
jgi:GT2 family glycosyltransferase